MTPIDGWAEVEVDGRTIGVRIRRGLVHDVWERVERGWRRLGLAAELPELAALFVEAAA